MYWKLRSKGGQPPRLYGLAKVHKASVPVRPVLSMPGSPYDNLGTLVTKLLSVIPKSQIRCTKKGVVEKVKKATLGEDKVIALFNVSSLYTNVPSEEAIQDSADILRRLWETTGRQRDVYPAGSSCMQRCGDAHSWRLLPTKRWALNGRETSTTSGKYLALEVWSHYQRYSKNLW